MLLLDLLDFGVEDVVLKALSANGVTINVKRENDLDVIYFIHDNKPVKRSLLSLSFSDPDEKAKLNDYLNRDAKYVWDEVTAPYPIDYILYNVV